MQLFLIRVPSFVQSSMSSFIWFHDSGRPLLTFDDGPHPETTPWILEYLDSREIKAMFFV